jgi:hypothetical protein
MIVKGNHCESSLDYNRSPVRTGQLKKELKELRRQKTEKARIKGIVMFIKLLAIVRHTNRLRRRELHALKPDSRSTRYVFEVWMSRTQIEPARKFGLRSQTSIERSIVGFGGFDHSFNK